MKVMQMFKTVKCKIETMDQKSFFILYVSRTKEAPRST